MTEIDTNDTTGTTAATSTTEGDATGEAVAPDAGPAPGAPRRRRRGRRWRTVALVLGVPLLVVAVGYLAFQYFKPHLYSGTVMQAPTRAPQMEGLVFADGSAVDLAEFRGDVVLVYFGYTHCPDICPTTLAKAATARQQSDDAERVHVMMVSVDPERDDPGSLGQYVESFDPSFLGATGDAADLERVAATYGVFFARGEEEVDGYAVDHTASLMGIDTDGRLRIVWPTDVTVADLTADLDALL